VIKIEENNELENLKKLRDSLKKAIEIYEKKIEKKEKEKSSI
jgi:hypothetical protein